MLSVSHRQPSHSQFIGVTLFTFLAPPLAPRSDAHSLHSTPLSPLLLSGFFPLWRSMASDPTLAAPFVAAPYVALQPPDQPSATPAWHATRACRIAPAVLMAVALLTLGLLTTLAPTSWYSNTRSSTTQYAGSICEHASQAGEPSIHILCSTADDGDRCCPLWSGYGDEAVCSGDGQSCYGYNDIRRFFVIVALWVAFGVSLCVICCCLACSRRQLHYRQHQTAEGVYLVVEDSGSYGRVR